MTEQMQDRPSELKRRAPKPAPDERIDPVDAQPTVPQASAVVPTTASQPDAPASKVGRPAGRREITAQLGTRISLTAMQVLDQAVAEHGITIRSALEQAILAKWGRDD